MSASASITISLPGQEDFLVHHNALSAVMICGRAACRAAVPAGTLRKYLQWQHLVALADVKLAETAARKWRPVASTADLLPLPDDSPVHPLLRLKFFAVAEMRAIFPRLRARPSATVVFTS